ncbi:MAG: CBS domain-containing protein [Nanoarchaeota archaeon]|mgnify:CR=1 FL=1
MNVEEVMSDAFIVEKDMSLADAAKLMSDNNTDSLIYILAGQVKGIITEEDIIKNFGDKKKISQIMSKNVVMIDSNKDLNTAFELMKENKIKRIPVVKKGEVVGIVTVTDMLANADELDEPFFF